MLAIRAINNLTEHDQLVVIASFVSMFKKEYDCNTCLKLNNAKRDGVERRKLKGCFDNQNHVVYSHNRIANFKRCPANLSSNMIKNIIGAHLSSGQPSFESLMNMSAKLADIYKLIDNLISMESQQDVRHRSQNKPNSRGASRP